MATEKPSSSGPTNPNVRIDLTLTPSTPRTLDDVRFDVIVRDRSGRPAPHAKVHLTLTMPSMQMPPNEIDAARSLPGIYAGHGQFTMEGAWSVQVSVDTPAGHGERNFPAEVRG